MAQNSRRYDCVAGDYTQVRPRYPDELVGRLAALIGTAPAAPDLVLDIGSGTGAFSRQLRPALPAARRLVGVEPGAALRELALPHRVDDDRVRFGYLFQCITVRREA